MSRDDGFKNADIDTTMLDDPKLRRLHRLCGAEDLAARSIVAYLATVLASWQTGERVKVEDAAPLWLTDLDAIAGKLEAAELVDADHRILERAWLKWYGPANQRRSDRHFEGVVGGLMRSMGLSKAEAMGEARRRQANLGTGAGIGQVPVQVDLGSAYPDPADPGPRDEEKNGTDVARQGAAAPRHPPKRCAICRKPLGTDDPGLVHPDCGEAYLRRSDRRPVPVA